ncbi:tRNA (adenosine(37)-N6)-threonylcarbamoyltransferase complex dimerization subunit type 1 TsaB [Tepidibacillus infernus]|uniref:tRNA (adenosine(37)-N6)-threonylcarbamoyltransferase complex dimerization subunit type 1 TsaB n=1 Tax=Tepidibacillus infernus TaxID=1806172 RepID=UPI003A1F7DC2
MKILAIDTSTAVMGVALLDEKKIYAEMTTNLRKNHSIRLMPTVAQLFDEVKWSPNEIDLVAVAKGPGSYTGVRIGVTTAKTFAWAQNIPIVGVSTLETMAYQQHSFPGVISPLIDARRGQAYVGLYQQRNDSWSNLEYDRIILLSDWLQILKKREEQVLFVGDDVSLHQTQIDEFLGEYATYSSSPFNLPRPSVIGWLAYQQYLTGTVDNTFDFAPAYLQLAEAEVKWLEKQKLAKG